MSHETRYSDIQCNRALNPTARSRLSMLARDCVSVTRSFEVAVPCVLHKWHPWMARAAAAWMVSVVSTCCVATCGKPSPVMAGYTRARDWLRCLKRSDLITQPHPRTPHWAPFAGSQCDCARHRREKCPRGTHRKRGTQTDLGA